MFNKSPGKKKVLIFLLAQKSSEWQGGNAFRLPFPDGSFDLVTTSDMLHHLSTKDRTQAVREMAQVLKPGGKLVIAEIAFTKQFVQVLTEYGFQNIRKVPLNMILWCRLIAKK